MSKIWIFASVHKNEEGHAHLDKIKVLELFRYDTEPIERLENWCKQYPEDLIYVLQPVLSGFGFNTFKVNIARHANESS